MGIFQERKRISEKCDDREVEGLKPRGKSKETWTAEITGKDSNPTTTP